MMNRRIVLVVDEDEVTTDVIESTLTTAYRVLCVSEGKRAIELALKKGIEIAVVSRCLPDIDGLEVLQTLTQKYPSLPVMFIAAAPTKDLIISAFRSGARDFIEKPFEADALLESINRVTGKNRRISYPVAEPVVSRTRRFFSFTLPDRIFASNWLGRLGKRADRFFVDSQQNDSESEECSHEADNFAMAASSDDTPPQEQEDQRNDAKLEEVIESGQHAEEHDEDVTPTLSVYCLGKFKVILDGQLIENWTSRKGRALFAYLVMNHTRRTYRDILMEMFWPNSDPDSARNCLNVAIHSIRRLLHKVDPHHEYILFKNECYFLNPEIEVWSDVEEFVHHWKIAQSIEREQGMQAAVAEYELAAAAYKGDFLEEDLYENWPGSERENFQEIYLFILDRLSKYYSLDGKPSTAISLCETILEQDNCREEIHQRLMLCYYRLGQRDKALKQFRKCAEVLEAELEVEPTQATFELCDQIKDGVLHIKNPFK